MSLGQELGIEIVSANAIYLACAARVIRVGYPDQSTHRIAVAWCSAGYRPERGLARPRRFDRHHYRGHTYCHRQHLMVLETSALGCGRPPSQAASRCRSRLDRNSSPLHRQRSSKSLAGILDGALWQAAKTRQSEIAEKYVSHRGRARTPRQQSA